MPFATFETALGHCAIAWTDRGVIATLLPERSRDLTVERLLERVPGAGRRAAKPPPWITDAIGLVKEHLSGRPQDFGRVPLDLDAVSDFEANVYRALREVPHGKTVTYGELASKVGSPGAARAVGRAMATNPIPVLVPCHRVLGTGGKMVGFSAPGGVETKKRILALEGLADRRGSLFDGTAPALPFDTKAAMIHLATEDPILGRFMEQVPLTLRLKETEGTFAALAESIVYQQLSGKAAATIFGRVRALFPKERLDPGKLLALPETKLRGAGLSKNKLLSLRDLADKSLTGRVPTLVALAKMDDDEIIETLTEVRGIGRWTVEMLLIFRLGRPDVLPVADLGVRKGFGNLFLKGAMPTSEQLEKRARRWAPYRSIASWYMWRATEVPTRGREPRDPSRDPGRTAEGARKTTSRAKVR